MRTIALVNQKGGVGKSTTAVNVSAGLARLGHRVLLIDLDPQAHATVALGLEPRKLDTTVYSLLSGSARPSEVIRKISDKLSIIPANIHLAGGEAELAALSHPSFVLKKAMAHLDGSQYDYAIVDSPPQLGFLNVNSLAWVREVYIPVTCEFYALHGLSLLLETVERIRSRINPDLRISGVITCQVHPRRAITRDVLADLERHFPGRVLKTRIRVNVRLVEAPSHGKPIFDYAPDSNGAQDYMSLAKELAEMAGAAESPVAEKAPEAQAAEVPPEPAPIPEEAAPALEEAPAPVALAESETFPSSAQVEPAPESTEAPALAAPEEPASEVPAEAAQVAPPEVTALELSGESLSPQAVDSPPAEAALEPPAASEPVPVESDPALASPESASDSPDPVPASLQPEPEQAEPVAEAPALAAEPLADEPAPAPSEEAPVPVEPEPASSIAELSGEVPAESAEPAAAPAEAPAEVPAEAAASQYVPMPPGVPLTTPVAGTAPSAETPVPAQPGASSQDTPYAHMLGLAGLKPIVIARPGGSAPAQPPQKNKGGLGQRLLGKLMGRKD